MTTKKKTTTGKGKVKKLTLKKDTINDVDAKGKGKDIKGGGFNINVGRFDPYKNFKF